jgi:glutathione peroxidase-family protein
MEATSFTQALVCKYVLHGFIYHRKVIVIVNVADTCYLQAHIIQLYSQAILTTATDNHNQEHFHPS